MNDKKLIYLCGGIGSVFNSQVLELLNGICEKNIFEKNYLLLGIRKNSEKLKLKRENVHPDLNIIFYKIFPNYPFYDLLNRRALRNALKLTGEPDKNTIFHIREEILTWHLLNVLDESFHKNILADIRGANMEEVKQFFGLNSLLEKLKVTNYTKAIQSLKKVKNISVVSVSLKNYLINKFGLCGEKIIVTSCLAGKNFRLDFEKRKKIRTELNLTEADTLLIFTSGGTADWQNTDALNSFAGNGFKVLNLSKKVLHHKNVINRFVDYYEIPYYLNAADIAVIWREESIVNKVASPVKFSEYLCCGLPVITNESIDLIKEIITENNSGIILNNIKDLNKEIIDKVLKLNREHISHVGQDNFGLETTLKKYQLIYEQFLNGKKLIDTIPIKETAL